MSTCPSNRMDSEGGNEVRVEATSQRSILGI
jgi:hypothetical protein